MKVVCSLILLGFIPSIARKDVDVMFFSVDLLSNNGNSFQKLFIILCRMLFFIAGGCKDMQHNQSKYAVKPRYLKMSSELLETCQFLSLVVYLGRLNLPRFFNKTDHGSSKKRSGFFSNPKNCWEPVKTWWETKLKQNGWHKWLLLLNKTVF